MQVTRQELDLRDTCADLDQTRSGLEDTKQQLLQAQQRMQAGAEAEQDLQVALRDAQQTSAQQATKLAHAAGMYAWHDKQELCCALQASAVPTVVQADFAGARTGGHQHCLWVSVNAHVEHLSSCSGSSRRRSVAMLALPCLQHELPVSVPLMAAMHAG